MNHPQISIIGAPKSGTSAVHFWLAGLKGVNAATPKETFFFIDSNCPMKNKGCNQGDHALDNYMQFYKPGVSGLTLDSTAHYLYQESAIRHFSEANTRVCVMLRDPVKRIASYYQYLALTQAAMRRTLAFDEYVEVLLDPHKTLPASFFYHARDHYALDRALDHGCYARYLDRWSESIDPDNLLIVLFEELVDEKNQLLGRVGDFFNLEVSSADFDNLKKENVTVNVRFPALNRFARSVGKLVPGEQIKKTLRDAYFSVQRAETPDLYKLYPEEMQRLVAHYDPHNRLLASKYNIDTTPWGKPRL